MTLRIILDTNFLLTPTQFKIDIFEALTQLLNKRYDPIILSTTRQELESIAQKGTPKLQKQAKVALTLAEKCHRVHIDKKLNETNDDVIFRIAAQWKSPVATNDQELRRRLRNISIPVIYLRQKSRLDVEGSI